MLCVAIIQRYIRPHDTGFESHPQAVASDHVADKMRGQQAVHLPRPLIDPTVTGTRAPAQCWELAALLLSRSLLRVTEVLSQHR
jgi:hypothetical protein